MLVQLLVLSCVLVVQAAAPNLDQLYQRQVDAHSSFPRSVAVLDALPTPSPASSIAVPPASSRSTFNSNDDEDEEIDDLLSSAPQPTGMALVKRQNRHMPEGTHARPGLRRRSQIARMDGSDEQQTREDKSTSSSDTLLEGSISGKILPTGKFGADGRLADLD